jgi:hypothetical protein
VEVARDERKIGAKINGRVALGVTSQGSHRSGLAQLTHPARLAAVSHALRYPWSLRGQLIGVQSPRTVARPRFRNQAPPSLHRVPAARVPRLPRYYEVLRFPYALPAALRFLQATVTIPCACVRSSVQVRRRPGARGFRVWQPLKSQFLKRWQRTGVPSSWGILMCLRPALRPRRDRCCQAMQQLGTAPRAGNGEGSPRFGNFGAQSHGIDTRCLRFAGRLTPHHARLASGCLPGSTRRDWLPAGFH